MHGAVKYPMLGYFPTVSPISLGRLLCATVSSMVVLTVGDDIGHCFQGPVRTSK